MKEFCCVSISTQISQPARNSSQRNKCVPSQRDLARHKASLTVNVETDVRKRELKHNRRDLLTGLLAITSFGAVSQSLEASALGFKKDLKKRKSIDETLYTALDSGLKILDLEEGRGDKVVPGTRLEVHYDCKFRGIDVVSSRSARLLGGNRTIAEPLDFIAGEPIVVSRAKIDDRGGGGLFAGSSGPKPPPALSTAVYGMKKGGKRSVIVPPELGYGDKGLEEIPPNTPFELLIEVLQIK